MKKVYWRPRVVSRTALLFISLISLGGLVFIQIDYRHSSVQQPNFKKKLEATHLAEQCMRAIRAERQKRKIPIDQHVDPADSGLIGVSMSFATSVPGVLSAKQTSINPNFAAVIVDMLLKANVEKGDKVAVGFSGSFPALNICVCAALETLKLKPIAISSAAASQWGANIEDFLWLDMERILVDQKLISFRSTRASLGGVEDSGLGMTKQMVDALKEGIRRSDIEELPAVSSFHKDNERSFEESVTQRMKFYKQGSEGQSIQAYINVGGGTSSVGKSLGKKLLPSGLNFTLPYRARNVDSVMTRFLREGVPVIHLVRINELAQRYGLTVGPSTSLPNEGQGEVFYRHQYNLVYTAGVLGAILLSLYLFIRSDWGFRIFQTPGRRADSGHPEPMI